MCHVQFFATPQTIAHRAPLSMRFSREEYWSGLPFPSPGDLPNPGVEPVSLKSPALADSLFTTGTTWEAPNTILFLQVTPLQLHSRLIVIELLYVRSSISSLFLKFEHVILNQSNSFFRKMQRK